MLVFSNHQRTRIYAVATLGLLILCGLRIMLILSAAAGVLPIGGDANAYLAAARAILHGQAPVGTHGSPFLPEVAIVPPYLYPPFLALVLVPLAALPYPAALYLWMALVALTTILLAYVLRPLVGWPAALLGLLFFSPAWESLWLGQINAAVAVMLALMLRAGGRGKDWQLGLPLALGTLLKVTPLLAGLVLLVRQRWGALWIAALTMLGVVAFSLPLVSFEAWFSGSLYALRSSETSHLFLSWTAILRRQPGILGVLGPLLLIAAMLAATLWRSRLVSLRLGLTAAALLPLLISGIIWHYTAILALPALAVLWGYNLRARLIALATWVVISLIGGIGQPIMLSLCWYVCCWPALLGPEAGVGTQDLAEDAACSG